MMYYVYITDYRYRFYQSADNLLMNGLFEDRVNVRMGRLFK